MQPFFYLYLMRPSLLSIICLLLYITAPAQEKSQYIRIAKIVVDSTKLNAYNEALKEHAAAAVKKEPGVLMLYVVQDKDKPTHVTVFEIYASVDAYKKHITTDHFKKYKTTVEHMVTSLVLTDVNPIALERKE